MRDGSTRTAETEPETDTETQKETQTEAETETETDLAVVILGVDEGCVMVALVRPHAVADSWV